ncbi:hypothetical protein MHYP_G00062970 [Metynnis hypsauchen]
MNGRLCNTAHRNPIQWTLLTGALHVRGVDPSLQVDHRIQASSQAAPPTSKHNKPRAANSRDERFRSDLHTEAVQAALAKYKERKMPMPSKRRSVLVQSSVEACTPPDTSSASEDEGSLRRQGRMATSSPYQPHPTVEHWFNRVIQGSSTSSSASSTSSHPGGRSHSANATSGSAATVLADLMAHTQLDNHCAPPDVTGLSERSLHAERPQVASVRGLPRGYTHTSSTMETADVFLCLCASLTSTFTLPVQVTPGWARFRLSCSVTANG